MRNRIININRINKSLRFDGSYHNAEINIYSDVIESHSSHTLDYFCDDIFTSGRNKRVYSTKKYGNPFLSNSDAVTLNPFSSCNYASKKYGYDEKALLKGGMILTGRVGAIGQTSFVPKFWENFKCMGSDNIIRIQIKEQYYNGYIYAYLASKMGYLSFIKHSTGGVQPFITDKMVGTIPIPDLSNELQLKIHNLIIEAARLREKAFFELENAEKLLKENLGLRGLQPDDYDYYGPRNYKREVSCFVRNIKDINTTTINAFNHSERIRRTKELLQGKVLPLKDVLQDGDTFSTGSFPRVEVKEGSGIMLINQSDIFDTIIKGKWISKRKIKTDSLVQYGEVLIAGVGTLGDNEKFCHAIFANESLQGELVSGEFIRMRTNELIPSGYLYTWLNTDFGFRLIRNVQAGTKLCRPIPRLLLEIPVPVIGNTQMNEIDFLVKEAHSKCYRANSLEKEAIFMVETEIGKWNKN